MKRLFNKWQAYGKVAVYLSIVLLFPFSHVWAQSITYTFNSVQPIHAPASDPFYDYHYDANGNLERITDLNTGNQTEYAYTTFNKLKQVKRDRQPMAGYLYDIHGKRIAKTDGQGGVVETYLKGVEKTQGGVATYYFLGAKRLAKQIVGGSLQFFHQDHLGSTSVMTNMSGTPVHEKKYYAFGAIKSEVNNGGSDDHAYNDKRRDKHTDMYDYDARSYAAKSFRFAQPDSIVPNPMNPQEFNRYAYVKNNPLKYIDPTGHRSIVAFIHEHMSGYQGYLDELSKNGDTITTHMFSEMSPPSATEIGKFTKGADMVVVLDDATLDKEWRYGLEKGLGKLDQNTDMLFFNNRGLADNLAEAGFKNVVRLHPSGYPAKGVFRKALNAVGGFIQGTATEQSVGEAVFERTERLFLTDADHRVPRWTKMTASAVKDGIRRKLGNVLNIKNLSFFEQTNLRVKATARVARRGASKLVKPFLGPASFGLGFWLAMSHAEAAAEAFGERNGYKFLSQMALMVDEAASPIPGATGLSRAIDQLYAPKDVIPLGGGYDEVTNPRHQ